MFEIKFNVLRLDEVDGKIGYQTQIKASTSVTSISAEDFSECYISNCRSRDGELSAISVFSMDICDIKRICHID